MYVVPSSKKDRVKKLKECLEDASIVYLATDEDREGESISWRLTETLKPKVPVKRLVFHEITKEAIEKALQNPRDIDKGLVAAQETRRIVDRIYGYSLSPLLWKKIRPKLSAGRVQSVAIRLVVEREKERISFHPSVYWDAAAKFIHNHSNPFEAKLAEVDGKKLAIGKDFDPKTGQLKSDTHALLFLEKDVRALVSRLQGQKGKVADLEEKPYSHRPSAPFTTSTLQQEANRRLNFSAQRTMRIAQKLYENGHITYMRTDSTTLSDGAIQTTRQLIQSEYGEAYLPKQPRGYKTQVKNAQEAHEAIRPTENFPKPEQLKGTLDGDELALYELIWKRTVASQMEDARGKYTKVQIQVAQAMFQATGRTIEFPGFRRAYVEGVDDPEAELSEQERILPNMVKGDSLDMSELTAKDHVTQPPARLTEATLVKELEARGIGRPSTYASIIQTILDREYVFKRGSALVPTYTAFTVVNLLAKHLGYLVDYQFTARMEDDLDEISVEKISSLTYLTTFYFGEKGKHPGLEVKLKEAEQQIDPRVICSTPLGTTPDGNLVEVRVGRYGPFLSHGEKRCGIPDDIPPDELNLEKALELLDKSAEGPKVLGQDPKTGLPVQVLNGRFGPYIQLGPVEQGKEKPKRASLLKGMDPKTVDLATALELLLLPREVGKHPETGQVILALNGPYGPYIQCGTERRSLPENISVLKVVTAECVEILKQPPRRRAMQRKASTVIKELGDHPENGGKVRLLEGRYGPYVTDGDTNASLPRGEDVQGVTLAFAVDLLKARAEKGKTKLPKKRRR